MFLGSNGKCNFDRKLNLKSGKTNYEHNFIQVSLQIVMVDSNPIK